MILPQLRAAERMAEQVNAVDPVRLRLLQKALLDLTGDAVDAADGRHDPQLVADPHFAAGPSVQLHLAIRRLRRQRRELRLVTVAVQIAQVGFDVLRMNVLPRRNGRERMADRLAVFDDVFALGDRAERKFVPARHRLRQLDDRAFQLNALSGSQIAQRHRHVILLMNLYRTLHKPVPDNGYASSMAK
ncbi:Uncharacterised protein [Serratia marcescens]|uniref:Uncharacterized protein n=1 Tax=Serratia marcescens TaxID=615 RepID=A0A379YGB8_SERMA|nr:Uncharacterised protein [Serratia marcescens]